MKLLKRLAAGLLAGVMAVGATISAGAIAGGWGNVFETRVGEDPDYANAIIYDGNHKVVYGDGETIETLTDLGTIRNFGDPEAETSILIPASELESYPVGTMAIVHITVANDFDADEDADDDIDTRSVNYVGVYVRDGKREDLLQHIGGEYNPFTRSGSTIFLITQNMKESGVLFTGYEVANEGELYGSIAVTVQSVEFTDSVAAEYEHKGEFLSHKYEYIPSGIEGVYLSGVMLDENGSAKITTDDLNGIPVGSIITFTFGTTKRMEMNESYTIEIGLNGRKVRAYVDQGAPSLTDTFDPSDEAALFYHRVYVPTEEFRLTEEMKSKGITLTGPSDVFLMTSNSWIPSESSEIVPVKPVVTPGFSSVGSSIQDVPADTVVTQKTAIADGKYNERFVKKAAAADVVGKTKATFTLSNGSVTKTVSTTKYNTALTADGETIPAGSGYVFLVYTLSGIPEDVTVTVTDVTLE